MWWKVLTCYTNLRAKTWNLTIPVFKQNRKNRICPVCTISVAHCTFVCMFHSNEAPRCRLFPFVDLVGLGHWNSVVACTSLLFRKKNTRPFAKAIAYPRSMVCLLNPGKNHSHCNLYEPFFLWEAPLVVSLFVRSSLPLGALESGYRIGIGKLLSDLESLLLLAQGFQALERMLRHCFTVMGEFRKS